jgi:DNA helicase-2/ATP-dependent DNA helicase PcrA
LRHTFSLTSNNIITSKEKHQFLLDAVEKADFEVDEEEDFLENLEKEISRVKSEGTNIDYYYSTNCPEEVFRDIYRAYEKRCKANRKIDFDDMIVHTYELFTKRPDILQKWQQQFSYILVDEFQDINRLQYENVKMLAAPENNLFVVGDDDQSIYGFRGAKPDIMLSFPKDFKGTKQLTLDVNYRCTPQILSAASKLINHNKKRYGKKLKTINPKAEDVHIMKCKNVPSQNRHILDKIKEYVEKGTPLENMAVLYRTNLQARSLVGKCMEYGIPFQMKEQLPDIFEHFIAKDIISYIKLAMGNRQRNLFLQICNRPNRYISRQTFTNTEVSFHDLYSFYHDKPWMEERLDDFQQSLIDIKYLPPYAAIHYLRKVVGYDDFLKEYSEFRGLRKEDLMEVLDEIQETAKDVKNFDEWFAYMDTYREGLQKKESHEGLNIMTMHGSKGLEFEVVFLPEVNEGLAPYRKAVLPEELEEERRMFYVAMTRAKKYLYLFYVDERYNKDMEPSRFIEEIMGSMEKSRKG